MNKLTSEETNLLCADTRFDSEKAADLFAKYLNASQRAWGELERLREEVEQLREALTSIKSTCKLGVYPMMSDDIVRIVDSAIQRIQEGMEHE